MTIFQLIIYLYKQLFYYTNIIISTLVSYLVKINIYIKHHLTTNKDYLHP